MVREITNLKQGVLELDDGGFSVEELDELLEYITTSWQFLSKVDKYTYINLRKLVKDWSAINDDNGEVYAHHLVRPGTNFEWTSIFL